MSFFDKSLSNAIKLLAKGGRLEFEMAEEQPISTRSEFYECTSKQYHEFGIDSSTGELYCKLISFVGKFPDKTDIDECEIIRDRDALTVLFEDLKTPVLTRKKQVHKPIEETSIIDKDKLALHLLYLIDFLKVVEEKMSHYCYYKDGICFFNAKALNNLLWNVQYMSFEDFLKLHDGEVLDMESIIKELDNVADNNIEILKRITEHKRFRATKEEMYGKCDDRGITQNY